MAVNDPLDEDNQMTSKELRVVKLAWSQDLPAGQIAGRLKVPISEVRTVYEREDRLFAAWLKESEIVTLDPDHFEEGPS